MKIDQNARLTPSPLITVISSTKVECSFLQMRILHDDCVISKITQLIMQINIGKSEKTQRYHYICTQLFTRLY